MTHQDERAVAALIESAHAPTSDTVPAIIYHSLMARYEERDTECAELHCANKRLTEQAAYGYVLRMQREVRRTRRFAWTLAATCAVLVAGIWGLVVSR